MNWGIFAGTAGMIAGAVMFLQEDVRVIVIGAILFCLSLINFFIGVCVD